MEYVRCNYSRTVSCSVCYPGLPSVAEFGVLKALGTCWFCQSMQNQLPGTMIVSICDKALPYFSCYQLWIAIDHLCFVNSVNKLLVVTVIKYVSQSFLTELLVNLDIIFSLLPLPLFGFTFCTYFL